MAQVKVEAGVEVIDQAFPVVPWTGKSQIHRSLAKSFMVSAAGPRHHLRIIKAMAHAKFPGTVWDLLRETFPGCDWLLNEEEFSHLFLVDMYLSLKGEPNSQTKGKIENPRTKNVFHRLAVQCDKIVCGIRYWTVEYDDTTYFSFRFRVALNSETGVTTRTKARKKIDEAEVEFASMPELLAISEPTEEEVLEARKLLRMDAEQEADDY